MPYCVNCGVELEQGERSCPLCGTEVVLPPGLSKDAGGKTLPPDTDEYSNRADRQLWFRLTTIVLLTPALLSLTINLMIDAELTWSIVVMASMAAIWVVFVSPLLYRRRLYSLWIVLDTLAAAGLLYLIEVFTGRAGWFQSLALPVTVFAGALVLILYKLIERGFLQRFTIVSGVFAAAGLLCLFIDAVIGLYLQGELVLSWSIIVLIPCAAVAVIFSLVQREQQLVDRLERWFHF